MAALFKKLNLKDGTPSIVVLDAAASFDAELATLQGVKVHRRLVLGQTAFFALAFALALAFAAAQRGLRRTQHRQRQR